MDKKWLDEKIHEEAEQQFEATEPDFQDNEKLRLAWQKVTNSQAFQDYRQLAIKQDEKEITHNILSKLQGLQGLFEDNQ